MTAPWSAAEAAEEVLVFAVDVDRAVVGGVGLGQPQRVGAAAADRFASQVEAVLGDQMLELVAAVLGRFEVGRRADGRFEECFEPQGI